MSNDDETEDETRPDGWDDDLPGGYHETQALVAALEAGVTDDEDARIWRAMRERSGGYGE